MDRVERNCNSAKMKEGILVTGSCSRHPLSVLEEKDPPKGFAKRKNRKITIIIIIYLQLETSVVLPKSYTQSNRVAWIPAYICLAPMLLTFLKNDATSLASDVSLSLIFHGLVG